MALGCIWEAAFRCRLGGMGCAKCNYITPQEPGRHGNQRDCIVVFVELFFMMIRAKKINVLSRGAPVPVY